MCYFLLLLWSRAQADAEARRAADRVALLAARRAANRAALKPEPTAGSPGTTALRVRLPDGSNHLHRFLSSAALQVSASVFQVSGKGSHLVNDL